MLKKKIILITIIFFLSSITLSTFIFINYDKELLSKSNIQYNNLIKGDSAYYFLKAREFQKNIDNKKIYFFSGEYQASFLYPILIGGFYYIFDQNVFNTDEIRKINPPNPTSLKLFFLILQSSFYFFSVIFLINKLKRLDKKIKKILFLFLIFEPTIFQYHSLFMTESISASFLNFFLGVMINPPNKSIVNFFIGLFIGVMYLLKTTYFYILIPVMVYYFFYFRKKFFFKILSILLGYIVVIVLIGYSNFKRSGLFYFIPTQANDAIYWYMADPLYSKSNGVTSKEAYNIKKEKENIWIKENNINLSSEKDRIKLSIYKKEYTINIIKDAPFITFKYIIWKTLQFLIISPLVLFNYFSMNYVDINYWKTDSYKLTLIFSIIYSLLFYCIVVIGFLKSFKILDKLINYFFLILIFYFTLMLGWSGGSRYNLPIIALLSIYFSIGLRQILDKFSSSK